MRNITAVVSSIFLLAAAVSLVWRIYKHQASPALGSRIIFLAVDLIGLAAFIADKNRDFLGIIVLLVSIVTATLVGLSIIKRDGFIISLQTFEYYYLGGAVLILICWLLTNNAFLAFLLTQVLVIMGYIPIVQKMFKFRRNTEFTPSWALFLLSYLVGSYPAYTAWTQHHEILPIVYVLRGIVCMSVVLIAGLYFDGQYKRKVE